MKISFSLSVDHSHICKVPANYIGDHVIGGGPSTCDSFITHQSAASGYPDGGGAWPLHGVDFSQTYDCSSTSIAIKEIVNQIVAVFGCCGGNSGAPESTCPPRDNSHICKVAGNYLKDHTTNAKAFGGPDDNWTC